MIISRQTQCSHIQFEDLNVTVKMISNQVSRISNELLSSNFIPEQSSECCNFVPRFSELLNHYSFHVSTTLPNCKGFAQKIGA